MYPSYFLYYTPHISVRGEHRRHTQVTVTRTSTRTQCILGSTPFPWALHWITHRHRAMGLPCLLPWCVTSGTGSAVGGKTLMKSAQTNHRVAGMALPAKIRIQKHKLDTGVEQEHYHLPSLASSSSSRCTRGPPPAVRWTSRGASWWRRAPSRAPRRGRWRP